MTAPLTPADADLRDFAFMPIDIVRLFGSEFHARASDAAWRAGVTLWLRAWHQVPAGSLPNDDVALCRLAELGRDLRTFRKTKADSLRGWELASDGRLYHATVAEKVNDAWDAKLRQRHRTFMATIRKHNERHKDRPNEQIEGPTYEDWLMLGRPEKVSDFACSNAGPLFESHDNVARDNAHASHATTSNVARDMGSKGQGQGQGQGDYKPKPSPTINESIPKPVPTRATDCLNEVNLAADWSPRTDTQRTEALAIIDGWLASGFDLNLDILAGIRQARSRKPEKTRSLKRFTSTIRGKHADRQGAGFNGSEEVGDLHRRQQAGELVRGVGAKLSVGSS